MLLTRWIKMQLVFFFIFRKKSRFRLNTSLKVELGQSVDDFGDHVLIQFLILFRNWKILRKSFIVQCAMSCATDVIINFPDISSPLPSHEKKSDRRGA
jgi:hypothetical protein